MGDLHGNIRIHGTDKIWLTSRVVMMVSVIAAGMSHTGFTEKKCIKIFLFSDCQNFDIFAKFYQKVSF